VAPTCSLAVAAHFCLCSDWLAAGALASSEGRQSKLRTGQVASGVLRGARGLVCVLVDFVRVPLARWQYFILGARPPRDLAAANDTRRPMEMSARGALLLIFFSSSSNNNNNHNRQLHMNAFYSSASAPAGPRH
jgi:hypothetical protein